MDVVENDDYATQLRNLRLILGKNFRPISTAALASLTGIKTVSIRGVEAGRRKLNTGDSLAITVRLGAWWHPESHQWVSVWDPEIPFSRLEYENYSNHQITHTSLAENKAGVLKALDRLLDNVQPKAAAVALLMIGFQISELAEEQKLPLEVLKFIEAPLPLFRSTEASLSARDKAIEARDKDLENLGPRQKTRTPAGKKRKAKP
jgi:hypothetical protein